MTNMTLSPQSNTPRSTLMIPKRKILTDCRAALLSLSSILQNPRVWSPNVRSNLIKPIVFYFLFTRVVILSHRYTAECGEFAVNSLV